MQKILSKKKKINVRSKKPPRRVGSVVDGGRKNRGCSVRRRISGVFSVKRLLWNFTTLRILLLLALVGIITGFSFWIVKNKYFQVSEISVTGLEQVTTEEILSIVDEVRGKNVFIISPGLYEKRLVETYDYVKTAYVEKTLPNKITVHIEEYEPIAVWRTVNGSYLIDGGGYVLEKSVTEGVNMDSVLQEFTNAIDSEELNEAESGFLEISEINSDSSVDEEDEDGDEEAEEEPTVVLDPELEKQIDIEVLQKENELDVTSFDFDSHNPLPDSFKKYPQIKIWTDEMFAVKEKIDSELLGNYIQLIEKLSEYSLFDVREAYIFSFNKVLVIFENDVKVYFNLEEGVSNQVNVLEFVWGRLTMDGISFAEIDLRFKRPVIRN